MPEDADAYCISLGLVMKNTEKALIITDSFGLFRDSRGEFTEKDRDEPFGNITKIYHSLIEKVEIPTGWKDYRPGRRKK